MSTFLQSAWNGWEAITRRLRASGEWLPQLGLRLILFWEFWESGTTKLAGSNWFQSLPPFGEPSWKECTVLGFPFPFDSIPPAISWQLATWFEILGALGLLLGLLTRFFSFTLMILVVVATVAFHWPAEWSSLAELWQGYQISNDDACHGNYKLALLFLIMLLPLLFQGAGKVSLDALFARLIGGAGRPEPIGGLSALGLALLALGVPLVFVLTTLGWVLIVLGALGVVVPRFLRH